MLSMPKITECGAFFPRWTFANETEISSSLSIAAQRYGVLSVRKRDEDAWEDTTREVSWAVVTGVVDHRASQAIYSNRGDFAPRPLDGIYRRVELGRQILRGNEDGTWSAWKTVAPLPTLQILDNLPEVEAEKIPDDSRSIALVDPLPFLTEGSWTGVDVERLLATPREQNQRGLVGKPGEIAQKVRQTAPAVVMLRTLISRSSPAARIDIARGCGFGRLPERNLGRAKIPQFHGPWSEPTNSVTIP